MSRGLTKAERLREMERLYFQRAYTDIEMAERLGVDRTTVFRDRAEMLLIEIEPGSYKIDRTRYLSEIRLNLNEALTLYLAARRASQQTRIAQPHTASALEKLALSLKRPMTDRLVKAADTILAQNAQPGRVKIIETIARSWVEQIKIRLEYQGLHSTKGSIYLVSPYLIEPSPWSDGTYLIGFSDVHGEVGTFKVERIASASLTTEKFTLPEDFNYQVLLQHAWGIWGSDEQPELVRLRFLPGVAARRLRESVWHPLEKVTPTEDGGYLWEAPIAEWREMLPWIRGWGGDVEVLGPEELREFLESEILKLAELYKMNILQAVPAYFNLWAKAEESQSIDTHALVFHMIDVAECVLALWNHALSQQTRQLFAQLLRSDQDTTGRILAFWAGLHDIGKASPVFQAKYVPAIPKLQKVGLKFPTEINPNPAPHGVISAWALKELFSQSTGMNKFDAVDLARALGGHHGAWPTDDKFLPSSLKSNDKGDQTWDLVRQELFTAFKSLYWSDRSVELPEAQDDRNLFLTLFSGLVTIADWIGSNADYFPFRNHYEPPAKYTRKSARRAYKALDLLGWIGWQADGTPLSFQSMFPFIEKPNPIQEKTIELTKGCAQPTLVILEAPTGIGKTETALYIADTWLQSQKGSGLYIAMPTQATSNQMFTRVTEFLINRYPNQTLNTHLIHGAALLADAAPRLQSIDQDSPAAEGTVKAETWFLPRKRTLLAPFGVGTVDQALMSVLQTNHFFVRLFGLGQKIIIFDEVHAYDTYMATLFERLLFWLRKLGTSVILLSATLPEQTLKRFVKAWNNNFELAVINQYPRLTIVDQQAAQNHSLPTPPTKKIALNWFDGSPENIANQLAEMMVDGGCVAVICNRVNRAQEVYEAIKSKNIEGLEHLILFHARFPYHWRKEIEDKVINLFGKTGIRPAKAVVVATQVIEQSLDLDFDYMISDLAPIDLLLQRAGRLHRHKQNAQNRPNKCAEPILALTRPGGNSPVIPDFGLDVWVYDLVTLLRTWLGIRNKNEIVLPEQTTTLIEAVYGSEKNQADVPVEIIEILKQAEDKAAKQHNVEIYKAKTRLVLPWDDEDLLSKRNETLEEDNPAVHEALRAMTRLAEPGVTLICLHQSTRGVVLNPEEQAETIDLSLKPDLNLTRELLKRCVNIQRREVVNYFINHPKKITAWRGIAALNNHFLVIFNENGESHPEGAEFFLRLTREIGLEILKEEQ